MLNKLLIALATISLPSAAMPPSPRLVIAIRDVTTSYCCLKEATVKLRGVVAALAPGDRFVLIDMGATFDPKNQVKIIAALPSIPPELLADNRIAGRSKRLEALNRKLEAAESNKKAILRYLERPPTIDATGTDVYGALRYVASLVNGSTGSEEKHVLWFSDMIHHLNGVQKDLPPGDPIPMMGARVQVLFMPYGSNWDARKLAWARFFSRSGSMDVQVYDAALSSVRVVLAKRPLVLPAGIASR